MRQVTLFFLFVGLAISQCNQQSGTLTGIGSSASLDNTTNRCTSWSLTITTNGPIARYSTALQGDFGSGFVDLTSPSNPCTTVTRCVVTYSGPFPNAIRENTTIFTSVPAGGSLTYTITGANANPPAPSTSITINGVVCTIGSSCTVSSPTVLAFQYVNTTEASPGSCTGSVFAYTGFAALTTAETITFSLSATSTVLIDYRAQLTAAGSSGTFGTVAVIDGTPSSIQSAISIASGFVGRDTYVTQVSLASGSHTIAMQHCGTASINWQARSLVAELL